MQRAVFDQHETGIVLNLPSIYEIECNRIGAVYAGQTRARSGASIANAPKAPSTWKENIFALRNVGNGDKSSIAPGRLYRALPMTQRLQTGGTIGRNMRPQDSQMQKALIGWLRSISSPRPAISIAV